MVSNKYIHIFVLFFSSTLLAQVDFEFDPIHVTASRIQNSLAQGMRNVTTLERDQIKKIPAQTVSDLLQWAGSVHLVERGNVQTDFSINGSSFEQVLVLVDGIRMNDPQTGHHNADFAITLDDIERIEVMPGHGSSMYGADGYGGVIQIVTREHQQNHLQVSVEQGSFQSKRGTASLAYHTGSFSHRLSFEKAVSDGYSIQMDGYSDRDLKTDYDTDILSYRGVLPMGNHRFTCQAGFKNHDFAAYGFYAPWPSREQTKTYLGNVDWQWQKNAQTGVQSKIWMKRHDDHFVLDEFNPEFYLNDHETVSTGFESTITRKYNQSNAVALGMEAVSDKLVSSGLGDHSRMRYALFFEGILQFLARTAAHLGVRSDYDSDWGFQLNPDFGLVYSWTSQLQMNASVGRIFRAPSFTDLYYNSPGNIGNPDLKPESGWNYETGIHWADSHFKVQTSVFVRDENGGIEWIKYQSNDPWQAVNIGDASVYGISLACEVKLNANWQIMINANQLKRHVTGEHDYTSKYEFRTPKHQVRIAQVFQLPRFASAGIYWNLIDREKSDVIHLVSLHAEIPIWRGAIFVDGKNLLSTQYEDIPGVVQAGRNFMTGFRLKIQ